MPYFCNFSIKINHKIGTNKYIQKAVEDTIKKFSKQFNGIVINQFSKVQDT